MTKEKVNNQGFDVEEVLVKFDREKMEYAIMSSDGPMDMVKKLPQVLLKRFVHRFI